jgi:hypothetical protein
MRRFFEKTGCLMTATGENDKLITPEGSKDYSFPRPAPAAAPAPAPAAAEEEDTEFGAHAFLAGEIEHSDSDEGSDAELDEDGDAGVGEADTGDAWARYADVVPKEEGGAAWVRVASMPTLNSTLVGQVIVARFGNDVGWCVGRVRKFYTPSQLRKGKFNVECKYEDGDLVDHTFNIGNYASVSEVSDAELDKKEMMAGTWVVIRKPA